MTTAICDAFIAAMLIAALCGCVSGDAGHVEDPAKEASKTMEVTSSAFSAGGPIPAAFSAYGNNESPPLKWVGAPVDTKSFAVVLEDPDAPGPTPFVHWVIYNIPATVGTLETGVPAAERLNHPTATMQGKNSKGDVGYFGPRPPVGDEPHHYRFKVYALDTMLALQPSSNRDALLAAMKGHVLASGELIGTYQSP